MFSLLRHISTSLHVMHHYIRVFHWLKLCWNTFSCIPFRLPLFLFSPRQLTQNVSPSSRFSFFLEITQSLIEQNLMNMKGARGLDFDFWPKMSVQTRHYELTWYKIQKPFFHNSGNFLRTRSLMSVNTRE